MLHYRPGSATVGYATRSVAPVLKHKLIIMHINSAVEKITELNCIQPL